MFIKEAINLLKQSGEPYSDTPLMDAQVLVAHFLNKPRTWVMAHPEHELTSATENKINSAARQLKAGTPLPYILSEWEFYGREFIVTPDVLIPRPETEMLVEEAVEWLRAHPEARTAAEAGVGSGIISISIGLEIPGIQITATDISPAALKIAQQNAKQHLVEDQISIIKNDLLEGLSGPFDLIVSNPPYIPTETLQSLKVAGQEPTIALDGGEDGLDLIRRLITCSAMHLNKPGLLLLEFEYRQGGSISNLAEAAFPGAAIEILKDLAGHDRVLKVLVE